MPPTPYNGDDFTPMEPDNARSLGHHKGYHNAGPVPLGRPRGSYRTVQRFFSTVLPWATLFWVFFRPSLHCPEEVYVLAGDAVVITKVGKTTHGLDRFSRACTVSRCQV